MIFALMLGTLPKITNYIAGGISIVALGVLCYFMITNVTETQVGRRWAEDGAYKTYLNFDGSAEFLDSLNIPRDAKILSLYAYPQNGPFIQMKRKGYTVMTDDEDLINAAFTWDFDYIVIENGQFAKHLETRREILSKLKKIGGNKHISVCTPTNNWIYQKDWQFFYPTE